MTLQSQTVTPTIQTPWFSAWQPDSTAVTVTLTQLPAEVKPIRTSGVEYDIQNKRVALTLYNPRLNDQQIPSQHAQNFANAPKYQYLLRHGEFCVTSTVDILCGSPACQHNLQLFFSE